METYGTNGVKYHMTSDSNARLDKADYSRRRKQFVDVPAEHKMDGSTIPKEIHLADGRHYAVELAHDPFSDESWTGSVSCMIYPVLVQGTKTLLFDDGIRWYVLMKT